MYTYHIMAVAIIGGTLISSDNKFYFILSLVFNIVLIVVLILVLYYHFYYVEFRYDNEISSNYIYMKINDNKYEEYHVKNGEEIFVNLYEGDLLTISSCEYYDPFYNNSLLCWQTFIENPKGDYVYKLDVGREIRGIDIYEPRIIRGYSRNYDGLKRCEFNFQVRSRVSGQCKVLLKYLLAPPYEKTLSEDKIFKVIINVNIAR